MGVLMSSISAIATAVRLVSLILLQLYDVNSGTVNLFASCFFFSALLFNFPASYIIGHKSIKLSLLIGCCTTMIGVWMRTFVNLNFTVAVVGQCIAAIGVSFFSNAPSQISARWFHPQNRGTPTMLMNICLLVFSSIIPIVSVQVIDKEPSLITPQEQQRYRSRLQAYFLYEAIYCSASSIIGLILFRERPSPVTSISELIETPPILKELKDLVKNCYFLLCVLALALAVASYNGLHILSQQILKKYGMLSYDIALINLIYIPASLLSVILQGRIFRYLKRFKRLMLINYAALLTLIVLLQFILPTGIVPLIGAIMVLQASFISPNIGLSMQLAASLTFPVTAGMSAGIVIATEKLFGFLISQGLSPLVDAHQQTAILLILLTIQAISVLLFCFIKEPSASKSAISVP